MTGAQATIKNTTVSEATADLHALLDIARSSFFEEDSTSIGAKSFEKAESLLSLVQANADYALENECDDPKYSGVVNEDDKNSVSIIAAEMDNDSPETTSDIHQFADNVGVKKPEEEVGFQHLDAEPEPATTTTLDFQKETFNEIENIVVEDISKAPSEYNSEQIEAEYNRGFEDAVSQLQTSIDAEKKELSDVLKLAIITGEELGSIAEQLIKAKLNEVSQIFIGKVIDETPDYLVKFIEKTCRELSDAQDNIKLTLSEDDEKVLRSLEFFGNTSTQIDCDPNFERGHFKIQMGHSYIEKHFNLSR